MEGINREDIRKLVEIFYQPPFKTFYVNSLDGTTFVKPTGVFVSLGITTSFQVLSNIKDVLNNTPEYTAQLVELSSTRVAGQYLNSISSTDPKQILIPDIKTAERITTINPDEKILDEIGSIQELEGLKNLMHPDQDFKILQEVAPRIGKLQKMIDRLNQSNGWDSHWIQKKSDGSYKLFHRYINYADCGDVEYRIGIYVTLK